MTLTLDNSRQRTVGDVITEISRLENRDLKSKPIDEKGKSRTTVRIVLNDKLFLQNACEAQVRNGDTLLIFPQLAGG